MARGKLTDKQLQDAIRRHLNGESIRSIAKELNMSESALRERISTQAKAIKNASNQIIATHEALSALDKPAQLTAHTHAALIMSLKEGLGRAASNGVAIAEKISAISKRQIENMQDDELIDGEMLKGIMAAGLVSNTHAKLGIDLISISAREQKDESPKELESPVKVYLPSNGR